MRTLAFAVIVSLALTACEVLKPGPATCDTLRGALERACTPAPDTARP